MATHDYIIANADGATVRADINDALEAIVSNNSSTSEPATTYAYMWWADTTNGLLKLRNSADSAWLTVGKIESSGNLTFEQEVKVNGSSSTGGAVTLYEDTDNGTNYVQLKAPASISSDLSLILPAADGSAGQALTTDGSGNLSFADAGGGKVLQVVSAVKTDTVSTQSATFSDIVTVSITPTSASSKILILASTNIGLSDAGLRAMTRLVRDSTAIFIGDAAGSRERASWQGGIFAVNSSQSINHTFLDSPATTSAITYKLQFRSELTSASYTVWINRTNTDTDSISYGRGATSITVMEIAA